MTRIELIKCLNMYSLLDVYDIDSIKCDGLYVDITEMYVTVYKTNTVICKINFDLDNDYILDLVKTVRDTYEAI